MEQKVMTKEQYIHSMHVFSRTATIIAVLFMLAMPFAAGFYFDAMPSFSQVFTTALGLLTIFVPTAISEVVSYTPVLGSSIYLTLVTGNVMNLKLPVATNAMQLMDISYGSEDADVISSIAVSISSFVTILIIILGVILMIPLQPVLSIPVVKTATTYILPALFGNLVVRLMNPSLGGGVTSPNRLKGAIVPTLLVFAIIIVDKLWLHKNIMALYQGIVIVILLPILYFGTKKMYEKGMIDVFLPGEGPKKK